MNAGARLPKPLPNTVQYKIQMMELKMQKTIPHITQYWQHDKF
jgi:hypothetical protein